MKHKIPRATLVIWGIIVAIVIVMATVCIVLILQGKWGVDGNDSNDYIEIKEENIQQDVSVIHLNWVSGDVQVKKSSNNQIRIVQKGSDDYPQEQLFSTKMDGDTLYIRYKGIWYQYVRVSKTRKYRFGIIFTGKRVSTVEWKLCKCQCNS